MPADPSDPIGWSGPGPKGGSAHITSHDNISGNSVVWKKGHGVAFSTSRRGESEGVCLEEVVFPHGNFFPVGSHPPSALSLTIKPPQPPPLRQVRAK